MLGRTGRRDSLKALAAAYDSGITFYDTARSYGYGAGERLLGEFFGGKKRESAVFCTKFGILPNGRWGWKQGVKPLVRATLRVFPGLRNFVRKRATDQFTVGQFSVDVLRTSLETSLRELKTEYVDILLMHAAPIGVVAQDDLMESLERLVHEGKVRMAGISCNAEVLSALSTQRPSVLQAAQFGLNIFNIGFTGQISNVSPSMFLIANQPFGGPDGVDRCRAAIAELHSSRMLPAELRAKLDPQDKRVLPELVLNCILDGTGVSVVVPAMMRLEHLRSNVQAVANCRFSSAELLMLRRALAKKQAEPSSSIGQTTAANALRT